ncbi:hypothetical protein R1flu_028442 [Riccia fluitans]|uniref:Uncharacterized protein n=1 Tax=Riccia fluitans TaxID=41844 RepID=A0ABD1XM57_9MARC
MMDVTWTRTGWTSAMGMIVQTTNGTEEYKGSSTRLDKRTMRINNPRQASTMAKESLNTRRTSPSGSGTFAAGVRRYCDMAEEIESRSSLPGRKEQVRNRQVVGACPWRQRGEATR